jgi:hypothetical protein
MALEKELATYHANLPTLLDQEGRYVVIHGDQVASTWQTYEDALKAGYEHFGLEPFLVKQIRAVEPVHYLSRGIPTCRS